MEEKKRHLLTKAIGELPSSEASPRIWNKIEEELDCMMWENKRENLKNAISSLPQSIAPEKVWKNIEKALAREPRFKTQLYFLNSSVVFSDMNKGM